MGNLPTHLGCLKTLNKRVYKILTNQNNHIHLRPRLKFDTNNDLLSVVRVLLQLQFKTYKNHSNPSNYKTHSLWVYPNKVGIEHKVFINWRTPGSGSNHLLRGLSSIICTSNYLLCKSLFTRKDELNSTRNMSSGN